MTDMETLPERAVIRLSGDDRRSFLQGLITQDLDRLEKDGAIFAALLTPQGKILFDFFVAQSGDDYLIDCFKEAAPALLKRLTLYKLRAKVTVEIFETARVAVSERKIPGDAAFADPRLAALGWRVLATRPAPVDNGAEDSDYHTRRISLGVPEFGADFAADEKFLLDVNYDALNGVCYKKGCFVGQEVTSRMKRKGEARRRTLIAAFDGAAPQKGAAITAGGSTLGECMSAAGDLALAEIRLDRWEKAKTESAAITAAGQTLHLRIPAYLEQG